MSEIKKMYIDGEWVPARSGNVRNVINPANGIVVATVAEGDEYDVKKAVGRKNSIGN